MFIIEGKYATVKVYAVSVDEECVSMLTRTANHPAFAGQVAVMPDGHKGSGCVIGFTMPMTDKVIPNVVGVDIGCGMRMSVFKSVRYDREAVDREIRRLVPFGTGNEENPRNGVRDKAVFDLDKADWEGLRREAAVTLPGFSGILGVDVPVPDYGPAWFKRLCERVGGTMSRHLRSLGTVGGGNHFVETGVSPDGERMALTVHTGSRNLGGKVCQFWQNRSPQYMSRLSRRLGDRFDAGRAAILARARAGEIPMSAITAEIRKLSTSLKVKVPRETGWLSPPDAAGYLGDMLFAQKYAEWNRDMITERALAAIGADRVIETVETVHNYVDYRDRIVRKGAIRSYEGEKMVIPFNMEDGVLLCVGKSNPDWNFSAPHGAGRAMSRSMAGSILSGDAMIRDMRAKDIFCKGAGQGLVDESREAYKPASEIEDAIGPTAVVLDRFIPYHNMKSA